MWRRSESNERSGTASWGWRVCSVVSKVERTVRSKGIVSVVKLEQSALHVGQRGSSGVCGVIEGFAASILASTVCDVAQCMHHGYSRRKYFMLQRQHVSSSAQGCKHGSISGRTTKTQRLRGSGRACLRERHGNAVAADGPEGDA